MAKQQASEANLVADPSLLTAALPAGTENYEDKTEDMVGYWNEDAGPIHCIPKYAVLFDNKVDPRNASILIFATLLNPANLLKKEDDEKTAFVGKPGDQVGIFAKPGMRRIAKLRDCKCLIQRDPTKDKDTGKPEPMKYFKVTNPPNSPEQRLEVMDDRRKESFERSTFLDVPGNRRPRPSSDTNGDVQF
jgi:hypothetical protein